MVVYNVVIFARTENVSRILMPKEAEWHFKVKCGGCGEIFPKEVTISPTEKIQVIKEVVNFQAKCKNCSRKGTISIDSNSTCHIDSNEGGIVKGVIATFDCRGLELIELVIGNSLTVHSSSGTQYKNADFNDLWAEYDDKLSSLCQVDQVKSQIVRK